MLTDGKPRGPCLMLQMLVPAASRNVRALAQEHPPQSATGIREVGLGAYLHYLMPYSSAR